MRSCVLKFLLSYQGKIYLVDDLFKGRPISSEKTVPAAAFLGRIRSEATRWIPAEPITLTGPLLRLGQLTTRVVPFGILNG